MRLPFAARVELRRLAAWLSLGGLVLGLGALCLWVMDPSPPDAGGAMATSNQFSEPRARAVIEHLSEGIGVRLNGTAAHRQAANYLAAELAKIPGFEVEIQEPAGVHIFSTVQFPPFIYRTLNVVGRLPGRSPEAVLLNAHFDTALDSTGAADDAAGVAALLETARALAKEAPLAHTLIVNLNGAEEIGLLGAAGFLKHRFAKDVRAYVYVEALPGGATMLFGAGPGNTWLAKTYARAVPRPFGNVLGQDLVEAKLLPHNGDFTPFHEAGLVGLDMAMTGDGWAYHTMLDRSGRLQPGSLQHLGESVLAVSRALARGPLPAAAPSERTVYYDIFGLTMLVYTGTTARVLAFLALALAGIVLFAAVRRRVISVAGAAAAFGWTLLSVLAGLLAAVAAAAFVSLALGRSSGWFSAPALAGVAFGAPAAAAVIAVHALWRRRMWSRGQPPVRIQVPLAGGLLFWAVLLVVTAGKGIGAGYIALYWVSGGAAALALCLRPATPPVAALACLLPGMIVTIQPLLGFLAYFIPITGMMGLGASDLMIAALFGIGVTALGALVLPVMHGTGGLKTAAVVLCGVGAVGLLLVTVRFPYTETRPKRVTVSHVADGDKGAVRIKGRDAIAMDAVLASLPTEIASKLGRVDEQTHELPAPPPPMPAPRVEIETGLPNSDAGDGPRRVTIRIFGTSPMIRLAVPKDDLVAWSLAPTLAATPPMDGHYRAQFYALDPAGHIVTLHLRSKAPVEIELRATDGSPPSGPLVEPVLKALPPWVTPSTYMVRTSRLKL